MITVRPARPADAAAMSRVLVASIRTLCVADHGNDPEVLAAWLANKTEQGVAAWFATPTTRLLVAERQGAIAAVGGVNAAREILLNYVAPAHRFAGVSTALLAAMEAALGPGDARLSSTQTAYRFYLAAGWADAGARQPGRFIAAWPMRKTLPG